MMCFRDMTFCSAECRTTDCKRNFTLEMAEAAVKWWGREDAPVAFSDFSGNCPDYNPTERRQG